MLGLSRLFFRKARHTLAKKPKTMQEKADSATFNSCPSGLFYVCYILEIDSDTQQCDWSLNFFSCWLHSIPLVT